MPAHLTHDSAVAAHIKACVAVVICLCGRLSKAVQACKFVLTVHMGCFEPDIVLEVTRMSLP